MASTVLLLLGRLTMYSIAVQYSIIFFWGREEMSWRVFTETQAEEQTLEQRIFKNLLSFYTHSMSDMATQSTPTHQLAPCAAHTQDS